MSEERFKRPIELPENTQLLQTRVSVDLFNFVAKAAHEEGISNAAYVRRLLLEAQAAEKRREQSPYARLCNKSVLEPVGRGKRQSLRHCNRPKGHIGPC